jgi:hypothetical protein
MTTGNTDVDILEGEPTTVELSDGREVDIQRLKTRQLFKLLKIVTRGGADLVGNLRLPDSSDDTSEFTTQLLALVAFSIPEAEDEAIEFIQSMVLPVGTDLKPKNRAAREANQELFDELSTFLANPEIEDTIAIIEAIVRIESKDIQRLGKRLAATFKVTAAATPVKNSSAKNSAS